MRFVKNMHPFSASRRQMEPGFPRFLHISSGFYGVGCFGLCDLQGWTSFFQSLSNHLHIHLQVWSSAFNIFSLSLSNHISHLHTHQNMATLMGQWIINHLHIDSLFESPLFVAPPGTVAVCAGTIACWDLSISMAFHLLLGGSGCSTGGVSSNVENPAFYRWCSHIFP